MSMNRRMKGVVVAAMLLCSASVSAQMINCGKQIEGDKVVFQSGETLRYCASYKTAVIAADVADIELRVMNESYAGKECFRLTGIGKTRPFYSVFFELEDFYTSWIERKTLQPVKASTLLKEGGFRYRSSIDYNWANNRVFTSGMNLKSKGENRRTMTLRQCSYDALALFYNLRCADLTTILSGQRQKLNLVLEDTIRTIGLRFIGRETLTIDGLGRFRTLKFACQFATSSDDSFKDGAEFFLWLSDDRNRIPIYLESPIRVGKIYATLSSWSGLMHPFSSIEVQ